MNSGHGGIVFGGAQPLCEMPALQRNLMELNELIEKLNNTEQPLGGAVPTIIHVDLASAKKLAEIHTMQSDVAEIKRKVARILEILEPSEKPH